MDEQGLTEKHVEFIAVDRQTSEQIAVEVKSKQREGVLHTKGEVRNKQLLWGDIQRLYRHALEKNPKDKPYLIFIDMNCPPTPSIPWQDKPWVKDIEKMMKKTPLHDPKNPDPCSGLVFTNYSYHYQTENEAFGGEHLLTVPLFPVFKPIRPNFFDRLEKGLANYGNVPNLDFEIGR